MPKNVIAVTKDKGGLAVLEEAVGQLERLGLTIHWVAEGLAAGELLKAGKTLLGGKPTSGFVDPKTLTRTDIDVTSVFDTFDPLAVIASQGVPNNLEGLFVREAARRGVKTVVVSDIHGSGLRANLEAGGDNSSVLFTTLDPVDTGLIGGHLIGHRRPKVVETGSPWFDVFASTVKPSPQIRRITSGYERVIYILGQDASTTAYLEGVITAVGKSADTLLVIGLHPKFLAMPEFCGPWQKIIKAAKVPVFSVTDVATAQQYMLASDIVVACYSTGLIEAVLLDKCSVSWVSPVGLDLMAQSMAGLRRFPTVTYGATIEVSSVEEWHSQVSPDSSQLTVRAQNLAHRTIRDSLHVDGHAAERVVAAIREHVGI